MKHDQDKEGGGFAIEAAIIGGIVAMSYLQLFASIAEWICK